MSSTRDGFAIAAREIHEKKRSIPQNFFIHKWIGRLMYRISMKGEKLDKRFQTDPSCNGFRTCEKVCPVKNITLEMKRLVWYHHCELCFACVHHCPKKAIQYSFMTRGKERYRNPEVSLKDRMRKS